MRNAGRNLTQEVLRLQRAEIQLAAVVKALIGGPGMEKSVPVDVVNATIPASLHLNVTDGLLTISCSAPKTQADPAESGGSGTDVPARDAGGVDPEPHAESAPSHTPPPRIITP